MNVIVPFSFESSEVRVIPRDGEPWFVLADVCRVLEIGLTGDAARRLDDDEKGMDIIHTPGGPQEMTIINESGLYSLILTSRKPAAKRFKKWVTADVIPSIRKTGGYGVQRDPIEVLNDPAAMRGLLLTYSEKVISLEAAVSEVKPKAAFYDAFLNAEGLYGLQNAARALGLKPNMFIQWLKTKYLFYQGSALVPYVQFRHLGIFDVKTTVVDEKKREQTYITPKGLAYLNARVPANVRLNSTAGDDQHDLAV